MLLIAFGSISSLDHKSYGNEILRAKDKALVSFYTGESTGESKTKMVSSASDSICFVYIKYLSLIHI